MALFVESVIHTQLKLHYVFPIALDIRYNGVFSCSAGQPQIDQPDKELQVSIVIAVMSGFNQIWVQGEYIININAYV